VRGSEDLHLKPDPSMFQLGNEVNSPNHPNHLQLPSTEQRTILKTSNSHRFHMMDPMDPPPGLQGGLAGTPIMSLFSVGIWIQSGNLGQGGKTGETKAPIAKMATDECIVSFVLHVEGGGPFRPTG